MPGKAQYYVPLVTTEAGSCLTCANWQEVGVDVIACNLDELLLKPGAVLLQKIDNLAHYLGWTGRVIVNASRLRANKEGIFTLVSPYDGARIKLNYAELFEIVNRIKPDVFIVPVNTINDAPYLWETVHSTIKVFIPANDLVNHPCPKSHGVYIHCAEEKLNHHVLEHVSRWTHLSCYVSGYFHGNELGQLRAQGVEYIETNAPALAGLEGKAYCGKEIMDLRDASYELDFDRLDSLCSCPTCSAQLTRAYLHHLYLNTPLLAQRFLIQHNAFAAQGLA
ncbi:hypothetical protein [Legionella worsleiensis]|uniref:Queuine tRNA-ribosyltransferase n=1 Tax=Legionella worsleiensis TaxID=45076 RepID=A0A0W1AJC8_9GAMM|nr:hypothetical protein [Legionella worsleiensis]KTD81320.1 queuine tRNA-ribosyltransferase [Legionella worsleiensis]STY30763.1 queuine tRNA-ribosyltransferase [Legionella worsleiensis]